MHQIILLYHPQNIAGIGLCRKYRICEVTETRSTGDKSIANSLSDGFITSRAKYCNSLLFGLPKVQI